MSQETARLREMWEAFNQGDFDGALHHVHPAVAVYPGLTELDVETRYLGSSEFKRFLETITEAWERYVVEAEEIIRVPDDRLIVVERWRARGRQDIELDFQLTDVYTFQDGLIIRIEGFPSKARALEALSLSEQDAHADS